LLALYSGWLSPELEHTLSDTTAAATVEFSQSVFIYLELCWHPVFFEATHPAEEAAGIPKRDGASRGITA
jgi:hypothetical protein